MLYVHMGFIKKISLGPQKISKTKFGHSRQFFLVIVIQKYTLGCRGRTRLFGVEFRKFPSCVICTMPNLFLTLFSTGRRIHQLQGGKGTIELVQPDL